MSLTPTQLSELQTIVEALRVEFPSSDDVLWEAAIRLQKGGLGPVTGPGGVPAFETAVADIVLEAEQISTVQGRQGGLGNSVAQATFNVVPVEDNLPPGTVGSVIYLDVAPNTYLSTDVVELTPAGPNSVVLSEIGTQVARTVAAASGGMEVNNLSTGAGFERVLTASDLGGGVNSVTGGVNINLTGTGVDPIVNLDAAITGVSVNGVTLTNAGVATNYLDETGAYSVPPAGGTPGGADTNVQYNSGGSFAGDANFTWDATNARLTINASPGTGAAINITTIDPSGVVIQMGGSGSASTNWDIFRSFDNGGSQYWAMKDDHALSAPNHLLTIEHSSLSPPFIEFDASGEIIIGSSVVGNGLFFSGLATTVRMDITNGMNWYVEERAAAAADDAGYGQFWVRNDTPNTPMFTDDTGVDHVLNAVASPGGADTQVQFNNSGAFGGSADFVFDITGNNTLTLNADTIQFRDGPAAVTMLQLDQTGAAASGRAYFQVPVAIELGTTARASLYIQEQAAAVDDFAGFGQFWVRNDVPNVPMFTDDAGTDFVLTAGADPAGTETISGAWTFTNTGGVDFDPSCEISLRNNADTSEVFLQNVGPTFQIGIAGADFGSGIFDIGPTSFAKVQAPPIFIREQAAAEADVGGDGQVWVRNDVPNTLMFTDDAGTDFVVSGAAAPSGVSNPMIADLDGDGFNLDDMGVLFMREQATADADVSTQGQIWVRTDTFSNTLMFTNDNGNDFEIAGIPLSGDVLPGTLVLSTTTYAGVTNIGPKVDSYYQLIITGEVTAPAADDVKLQLTVDTNSVFKGVYTDSNGQTSQIESVTGEVITNEIIVDTDGSASPDGTYFQIVGMLNTGATGQTVSLRAAKNADAGANGGIHGVGMAVIAMVEA